MTSSPLDMIRVLGFRLGGGILEVLGLREGELRGARDQGLTKVQHRLVSDLGYGQRVNEQVHRRARDAAFDALPQIVCRPLLLHRGYRDFHLGRSWLPTKSQGVDLRHHLLEMLELPCLVADVTKLNPNWAGFASRIEPQPHLRDRLDAVGHRASHLHPAPASAINCDGIEAAAHEPTRLELLLVALNLAREIKQALVRSLPPELELAYREEGAVGSIPLCGKHFDRLSAAGAGEA